MFAKEVCEIKQQRAESNQWNQPLSLLKNTDCFLYNALGV